MRGRYNFAHLVRYGEYGESTYRENFARDFDFLAFNAALVDRFLAPAPDRILCFDPCYVRKSGRHTAGVGRFWSGAAARAEWGLEFSGVAAVNLRDRTALHVCAVQTVMRGEGESALEYYASVLTLRAAEYQRISCCVVADAYFSRRPFVDALVTHGYTLVTRLRSDAYLRYVYAGPRRPGRGRPREFDGKIDARDLREDIFAACCESDDGGRSWRAFEAVANVKAWGRLVRVVVVHDYHADGSIARHRIYVSTALTLDGGEIIHRYQSRFAQEFLFRDAKQELGLEHCQAYSWEKIDFHLNTALTVGSLAKAAHHLKDEQTRGKPFSIADIKTLYVNELQCARILSLCGIDADSAIIRKLWPRIRSFGLRAA